METLKGYGQLAQINKLLKRYSSKRFLLVTGKKSYSMSGAKAAIEHHFHDKEYCIFNDFSVNPKVEEALKGTKIAIQNDIDLIVAIGGGSVLDIAKLIKAFISSPVNAESIIKGDLPIIDSGLPLVAIPTTAGSGSEATHFAVVYIGKDKYSIADDSLLPNKTILDGALLHSASSYQKAINGLDALAQAIEGCWAVNSTERSRQSAFKAIRLLVTHLPKIIHENNEESLQKVIEAAHLAGQVINVTKTTAAHAFSYAFTSYHDIPHGHAVWLTLPAIFEIHMSVQEDSLIDKRGNPYFQDIMNLLCDALKINKSHSKSALQDFMMQLKVEPHMEKLGINTDELKLFAARQVNVERLSNNPVKIRQQAVSTIFQLSSSQI